MARLVVVSYARSGWLLGEVLLVLGLIAVSSGGARSQAPSSPEAGFFFSLHGVDFLGATVLGAVLMTRRAVSERSYTVLARLGRRGSFGAGVMLAGVCAQGLGNGFDDPSMFSSTSATQNLSTRKPTSPSQRSRLAS